jgi:hypothetical protein
VKERNLDPSDREVLEACPPNGSIRWMGHAISENLASKDYNACAGRSKEVRNWRLGRNACGSRPYGLVMDTHESSIKH